MVSPKPTQWHKHPMPVTLETKRLILRPPVAGNLDAWAAFMADPESQRHLGGAQERPMAWRSLCAMAGSCAIAEGGAAPGLPPDPPRLSA